MDSSASIEHYVFKADCLSVPFFIEEELLLFSTHLGWFLFIRYFWTCWLIFLKNLLLKTLCGNKSLCWSLQYTVRKKILNVSRLDSDCKRNLHFRPRSWGPRVVRNRLDFYIFSSPLILVKSCKWRKVSQFPNSIIPAFNEASKNNWTIFACLTLIR